MTFQKGKSGNPSGRPKKLLPDGRSLRDIARDYTDKAIVALADVIDDDASPAAAKVSAATAILDRGWGRPTQTVEMDANVKVQDDDRFADFARRVDALLAGAASRDRGSDEVAGNC